MTLPLEPVRVISNLQKCNPVPRKIGPSWYDFTERNITRKLFSMYDQERASQAKTATNLVVGEHSFHPKLLIGAKYQIILFTDDPAYLLSGAAIESAECLYVFDAEHYHRVLRGLEKYEVSSPPVKIIPPEFFPVSFEPPRREPLVGIVEPDFPDDRLTIERYISFNRMSEASKLPVNIAFYVFSEDRKNAMLSANARHGNRIPVYLLNGNDVFATLQKTPNIILFTERSNHYSPIQFMLNKKIRYKHVFHAFDSAGITGAPTESLRNAFLDIVNQVKA